MQTVTHPGTRAGPYEPIEAAYVGAFSVVYRCLDVRLEREVAVKAVRPDCPEPGLARRWALREARVRGLVSHPHLLELLDVVPEGPALVGPWLEGGSLRDLGFPLPLAHVLTLARGLGEALDALHAAGWWHGDVSPGNVLLGGKFFRPVLADLGSARRIGARAVRAGTLVATPHVCAPEVWEGQRVDGRADLYSLGVLLYRAFTGSWPFDAAEPAAFAELHRRAAVPRTPQLGGSIEAVLLRAVAKDPDDRYATGAELATALSGADPPAYGSATVAAGEELERFAATLDERERAALRLVLRRSAAEEARAWHETEQISMQVLAPAAALLALEDSGAAAALAAGNETPAEVAASCGAPPDAVGRLLAFLAAAGLLAREGERYRLPPGPATLYAAQAHTGAPVRPMREAAAFWAHLSDWSATGEPFVEMDREDGAAYARAAVRSRLLAAEPARELAEGLRARGLVPDEGHVLDVGAGSAVWGIAISGCAADVRLTAIDRPLVLDVARANAEAAGLQDRFHALPGDWREVAFPAKTVDLAVLANVCHLEPSEEVARLLSCVRSALRRHGSVVVVDTMPHGEGADAGVLLQTIHLALRTPRGAVHGAADYTAWLQGAGFGAPEEIPLRTAGSLSALVARCLH